MTKNIFNFPLRVEQYSADDLNIIDFSGNVVVKLNWSMDPLHLELQRKRGEEIVFCLNRFSQGERAVDENESGGGKGILEVPVGEEEWGVVSTSEVGGQGEVEGKVAPDNFCEVDGDRETPVKKKSCYKGMPQPPWLVGKAGRKKGGRNRKTLLRMRRLEKLRKELNG